MNYHLFTLCICCLCYVLESKLYLQCTVAERPLKFHCISCAMTIKPILSILQKAAPVLLVIIHTIRKRLEKPKIVVSVLLRSSQKTWPKVPATQRASMCHCQEGYKKNVFCSYFCFQRHLGSKLESDPRIQPEIGCLWLVFALAWSRYYSCLVPSPERKKYYYCAYFDSCKILKLTDFGSFKILNVGQSEGPGFETSLGTVVLVTVVLNSILILI